MKIFPTTSFYISFSILLCFALTSPAYDSDIYSAYSKFFDAFSQAKRKRIFPKDLATFIDSFLVEPTVFDVHTRHPFNTSDDRYYFDYEEDEDHIYIWLNVYLKFSRGDIFMDEKSNTPVVPQVPEETERIGSAQISNTQEISLDTSTDNSSSDYFKAQNDQPVIENSSGLTLREKDLADYDATLKTYQMEMSDTSTTSVVTVVPAIISETPIAFTEDDLSSMNLDTLTLEINQYLNVARYSVIEVGKRLILAKKLVPHGEWADWLKHNFNLTIRSAQRFIAVADRFSNTTSMSHFDISTFKPTQLIALLALPKGQEKTFIETKAAEGTPIADMPVKKLRAEIKKHNADLAHQDSVSTKTVPESSDTHDTALDMPDTLTSISHTTVPLNTNITNSSDIDHNVDNALEQLFTATATLLHADNLQNVVTASAENDLQSLEQQLSQLAAIQAELQKYLADWEDTHINKTPIARDVIIAELKQMALQDMKNLTSALLLALVKSFGFEDMSQVPDVLLPVILRKIKAFHSFLLNM